MLHGRAAQRRQPRGKEAGPSCTSFLLLDLRLYSYVVRPYMLWPITAMRDACMRASEVRSLTSISAQQDPVIASSSYDSSPCAIALVSQRVACLEGDDIDSQRCRPPGGAFCSYSTINIPPFGITRITRITLIGTI
jgi:hypothetical protein